MSHPNEFKTKGLRRDDRGFFYEYTKEEGGIKKKKRIRLGHVSRGEAIVAVEKLQKGNTVEAEIRAGLLTFAEAADSFLVASKLRKKSFSRDVIYVKHLKAFFRDEPLQGLNHDRVNDFLVWRQKEREMKKLPKLENATLNHDLRCLKTIIRRAWLNGYISRNPLQGFRLLREVPRDRIITPEEFNRLLDASPPHLKPIVSLGFFTGMRIGEIMKLRWKQVDLKSQVITLLAQDVKTLEKREVPLTENLVEILKRIPRNLATPYVFTYKGKPLKVIKTAFNNACTRAGIEDLHFHDLRRCFVTFCRRSGTGEGTVMAITGHKTSAVFRRYNIISPQDRLEAVELMRSWTGLETVKRREKVGAV